jgi:hypothetical protein
MPDGDEMKKTLLAAALAVASFSATASIEDELGRLEGWTILGTYQITGWKDRDGKKGDAYEGCNYGRVLILNYQFAVTCSGYWYEYAYHPTVVILAKGSGVKMILNGTIRDVQ